MHLGREVVRHDDTAQCYAFSSKTKVEAFNTMITCTVLICDLTTNVLFDPGYNYSYVFVQFASKLAMINDILDSPIHDSILVQESVIVTHVYRSCPILRMSFQTCDDLRFFICLTSI